MKEINSKIGERKVMNCGEEAEIIEYNDSKNILVKFINTGQIVKNNYSNFKKGKIKSHFTPSVYGVGIIGLEKIKDENGKMLKSYKTWCGMLERCYDEKLKNKHPTYIDCTVCEEWLYYPNFKKWYEENYYEVNNETMCLDKDILKKGNKIYSPETCVFVQHNVNSLFTKSDAKRGKCPIGVYWNKREKKYKSQCKIFDTTTGRSKNKYLGYFHTPEEAFQSYKKTKEDNIKQVVDYYKDQIPKKLYDAMYRYEVEITD